MFSSRNPKELKSLVQEAGENAEILSVKDTLEANADEKIIGSAV